jgi:hypothetical protein
MQQPMRTAPMPSQPPPPPSSGGMGRGHSNLPAWMTAEQAGGGDGGGGGPTAAGHPTDHHASSAAAAAAASTGFLAAGSWSGPVAGLAFRSGPLVRPTLFVGCVFFALS